MRGRRATSEGSREPMTEAASANDCLPCEELVAKQLLAQELGR